MTINREAQELLKELAGSYPIVAISGPRQSGKTTLAKMEFPQKKYLSLEDLDTFEFAKNDPKSFLAQSKTGLIIDEIQKLPELFSYLQGIVDRNQIVGEFVITGSSQFGLMNGISQSLAGRVGHVELLPFSISEIEEFQLDANQAMVQGFYPPIYDRKIRPQLWYEDYVRTYIERDVRNIVNVKDLSVFQKFIALCAARSGQLINFTELGGAAGIELRTVKSWLSILEACYIIFLLKPHHKNFSKKLIKSPKLYFYDPGLLCYLLRIKEDDILTSPYRGHIFESMVISEYIKHSKNYRTGVDYYFWRDNKGVEVDLIYEERQKLVGVEIKSSATIHKNFFDNLKKISSYAANNYETSFLIHAGEELYIRENCHVIPWNKITF